MRHTWIWAILLLAGCQSVRGPFQPQPPTRVDDPNYSIREQEIRGRDRLAFPDNSPSAGPSLNNNVPGTPPR